MRRRTGRRGGVSGVSPLRHPLLSAALATLTERVRTRHVRWLRRHTLLDADAATDTLAWESSGFSVDSSVRIALVDGDVPNYFKSLGYFLSPLLSVLLGVFVLGERLRPAQWLAIAVAATGVASLDALSGVITAVPLLCFAAAPGKEYCAVLRLYGPTTAAIDKSLKPDDIEKALRQ